jgi:TolB-like protein
MSTYTKPQAPWATIEKVAVTPFSLPSENPTRRLLVTQLFAEELRKTGTEVIEVPLASPTGGVPTLPEIAQKYQVDAVFSGSVDDAQGTVVHVRLHDTATSEILWSGTYLLGVGPEFFSIRTQQQQFQKSIRRLLQNFSDERAAGS